MVFPSHLSFQIGAAEVSSNFEHPQLNYCRISRQISQGQAHKAHFTSLESDGKEQVALLIVL